MALASGSQLGPYQIVGPLGVGGMGEVYRATDSRLRREVAIKVVPDGTASDPQRMARFAREAQFLAALNHPNIASIYGFEESSNKHALIMELVEGPTLADRITQGPTPLEDALPITRQITEALEYAHDRGIVHRDLKPANIKIKPDGTVKVLDFGLAKALSDDSSNADIWSFGTLFFEMLTGKVAFKGETISDTLAAVIRGEPDWTLLLAGVPFSVQQLIRRYLNKDAWQRLQSIGEARIAIENINIWIYDLERGALRRITFAPGVDELAIWSPDGKRIAYASNGRQQAFVLPVDGSSPEQSLMKNEGHFHCSRGHPTEKLSLTSAWEIPGNTRSGCCLWKATANRTPISHRSFA